MPSYVVQWEIDAEAATPVEAVRQAFAAMRREGTSATVFTVIEEGGTAKQIDLTEVAEGTACQSCGASEFSDHTCAACEPTSSNELED
jgi:ribosomal protein L32